MSDPIPTPAPEPAPQTQPPVVSSAAFTQEQLNSAIADEKRKWKQQQDAAIADAKRIAAEQEAAAKGEFEKLANERGQRLATIEAEHTTATERLTAMEAEMERQIKARLKGLPEEIRDMAPEGDALMRFAWLEKAEIAASKLTIPQAPRPPLGTPSGARNGTGGPSGQSPADLMAQKRASGGYDL